jgi:hypothetical protein
MDEQKVSNGGGYVIKGLGFETEDRLCDCTKNYSEVILIGSVTALK